MSKTQTLAYVARDAISTMRGASCLIFNVAEDLRESDQDAAAALRIVGGDLLRQAEAAQAIYDESVNGKPIAESEVA